MDIKTKPGFFDLCVNATNVNQAQSLRPILSKLLTLGYSTVAVNVAVDESILNTEKKKKKKINEVESSPGILPEPVNTESLKNEFDGKLRILSRVTFTCSDPSKIHLLAHCATLKKYNLYAFAPESQNALQFACSQLNVDIISLRPTATTLKLNKKIYEQAIERGIHFEIQYGDILDLNSRKLTIHYSHLFHTYGKSKSVILSSGASDVKSIRHPYDIINVSSLLGLSEFKAKAAILHQCKILLLRAERRRRGKAVFAIEDLEETISNTEEDSASKRRKL